jgi:patatin-like phospholipase/acyl hydrolase
MRVDSVQTDFKDAFQILALDGGGYKGMFAAAILAAIEADLGRPIAQHFDLIVGTSTGGIIALALGIGLAPSQIVEFYSQWGASIFRPNPLLTGWGWWHSRYGQAPLRKALTSVLGDKMVEDSGIPLVIPAFDLGQNEVHLFKTPHDPRLRRDRREKMVDVALATSAAPTYFPAHILRGMRLADGGLWANNPVLIGIAEAVSLFGSPLEAVRVFSLGTTKELVYRGQALDQGGILQWARHAPSVILRGQSVGAAGIAEHLLSSDRYLRHDPPVAPNVVRIDRVDTDKLMGMAESTSRHIVPDFDKKFGKHIGRRPTFKKTSAIGAAT